MKLKENNNRSVNENHYSKQYENKWKAFTSKIEKRKIKGKNAIKRIKNTQKIDRRGKR